MLAFGANSMASVRAPCLPRADSIHVDGTVLLFVLVLSCSAAYCQEFCRRLYRMTKQTLRALQESSRSHSSSRVRVRVRRAFDDSGIGPDVVLLN